MCGCGGPLILGHGMNEPRLTPVAPMQASPTAGPDQRQTPVKMILSVLGDERDDVDVDPTVWGGHIPATASPRATHSSNVRGGAQLPMGGRITDESPRLSPCGQGFRSLPASVHKQVVRRSLDARHSGAVLLSPRMSRKSVVPDVRSPSRPNKPPFSPSPNLMLLKMLVQPSDKVRTFQDSNERIIPSIILSSCRAARQLLRPGRRVGV